MYTMALLLVLIGLVRAYETVLFDKNREKGTIYANWTLAAMSISYGVIVLCGVAEFIITQRKLIPSLVAVSLVLMVGRFMVKYWSHYTLGKFYSANIEIRQNHELILKGPYLYMRHPVYFSNLLDIVAICFFLNSFYTLVLALPLQYWILSLRIRNEEEFLVRKFGDSYREYMKRSSSMLPSFRRNTAAVSQ